VTPPSRPATGQTFRSLISETLAAADAQHRAKVARLQALVADGWLLRAMPVEVTDAR
jgi:hypothetical protein